MENTPHLYDTLVLVLCQHATWVDQRHLKTLAWMMVGLIQSGWTNLTSHHLLMQADDRDGQLRQRILRDTRLQEGILTPGGTLSQRDVVRIQQIRHAGAPASSG